MIKQAFALLAGLLVSSSVFAADLPDRIQCAQKTSAYKLVIVLKDPSMPKEFTAVGLKNGDAVIFKDATLMYSDEPNTLSFMEMVEAPSAKVIKLNLESKIAVLSNFELPDLKDGSGFLCKF